MSGHEWDCLLSSADEWIVNYSLPYSHLTSVKLFSVGHAFELYLKAANTKLSGDIDHAVNFGHHIPKLWADCKRFDPKFLPEFDLRQSVLDLNLLQDFDHSKLKEANFRHYMENQEIYIVAKYLADLKYLGAPLKNVKGAFAFGVIYPNPIWTKLFRSFRKYLGHPSEGKLDLLAYHMENGELPKSSMQLLAEIISGPPASPA